MVEKITFEEYLKNHPLLAFSSYTGIQVEILNELGQDICSSLDRGITDSVDAQEFNRVYAKFWLWVLGAYEVTRTMKAAEGCFSESAMSKLKSFYSRIKKLRIPFAKQEIANRPGKVINAEASVHSIDFKNKDIIFNLRSHNFPVRQTIMDFEELIRNIKKEDIICDLRLRPIQSVSFLKRMNKKLTKFKRIFVR